MELSLVETEITNREKDLCSRPPFVIPKELKDKKYNDISEKTQSSVYLQKEIEIHRTMMTTRKRIDGKFVTDFVHDQADSSLCTSISTISALTPFLAYTVLLPGFRAVAYKH